MSFLQNLSWRYATKKFDTTKKVSPTDLAKIKEAIRMAPSSYGLQPYHIVEVTDVATRKALRASAWDQAQITDASHLFVFCARADVSTRIGELIDLSSGGSAEIKKGLDGYKAMMEGAVNSKGAGLLEWSARQAYIALGFGLASCAELTIDACPMEGFDPEAFKKTLALPAHITPFACMAIGYRDASDTIRPKVRFPENDLFSKK
ncbi:MAG: hypothetical protein RLZZ347_228 [Candidatus Parcubacteria bacterium]|jgi:nitroreductase